jgi:hypothetical protein
MLEFSRLYREIKSATDNEDAKLLVMQQASSFSKQWSDVLADNMGLDLIGAYCVMHFIQRAMPVESRRNPHLKAWLETVTEFHAEQQAAIEERQREEAAGTRRRSLTNVNPPFNASHAFERDFPELAAGGSVARRSSAASPAPAAEASSESAGASGRRSSITEFFAGFAEALGVSKPRRASVAEESMAAAALPADAVQAVELAKAILLKPEIHADVEVGIVTSRHPCSLMKHDWFNEASAIIINVVSKQSELLALANKKDLTLAAQSVLRSLAAILLTIGSVSAFTEKMLGTPATFSVRTVSKLLTETESELLQEQFAMLSVQVGLADLLEAERRERRTSSASGAAEAESVVRAVSAPQSAVRSDAMLPTGTPGKPPLAPLASSRTSPPRDSAYQKRYGTPSPSARGEAEAGFGAPIVPGQGGSLNTDSAEVPKPAATIEMATLLGRLNDARRESAGKAGDAARQGGSASAHSGAKDRSAPEAP